MVKFCPRCGKPVQLGTSKFCDDCGANLKIIGSGDQKESIPITQEEKNPYLAGLCSFCIPGLGQVYDGETAKGIAVFFGTLIGLFIYIIPGLIVWLFGMYDAFSTAKKMNNKIIPFKPTKTAHMILFFILVLLITAFVIFVVMMFVLNAIFSPMSQSLKYH